MKKIIIAHKQSGETPLMCLQRVRIEHGIDSAVSMTYAGRLDPLATGVLPILVGEAVHDKKQWLEYGKIYTVEVLLGITTDTGDVMGMLTNSIFALPHDYLLVFKKTIKKFTGNQEQRYPIYSSKPINGKPLFVHAREGSIDTVVIPSHSVTIESIQMIDHMMIATNQLQVYIQEKIASVSGDFRQREIIECWNTHFSGATADEYSVVKIQVTCSSGTYMRQLVGDMGDMMGVPMLAYHIHREKIIQ